MCSDPHTLDRRRSPERYARSNSALLMLCLDKTDDAVICGRIYSVHLKRPVFFRTLDEMLILMDDIYDFLSKPQAQCIYRSFHPASEKELYKALRDAGGAAEQGRAEKTALRRMVRQHDYSEKIDFEMFNACQGRVVTFIVHTLFRQHASWQGKVFYPGKPVKSTHFRSALELLHIISDVIYRKVV